jgi:hypothetical protein
MSIPTRKIISAEFTRPNDTTAYAAGDAVSDSTTAPTALTFSGTGMEAGTRGRIIGAKILKSGATIANSTMRLHVFTASPVATNDNSAMANAWSQRTTYVGPIVMSGFSVEGGLASAFASNTVLAVPFDMASGSRRLYGLLSAAAAYTPAANEEFRVELYIEQDS